MSTVRPPQPCDSVKEFLLEESTRDSLGLPNVLLTQAQNWPSIDNCIQEYFTLNQDWEHTGHALFNSILTTLETITNSNLKKLVKNYSSKVLNYYQNPSIKLKFSQLYKDTKREHELEKSDRNLDTETEITSNHLIIDHQVSQRQELILNPRNTHAKKKRKLLEQQITPPDQIMNTLSRYNHHNLSNNTRTMNQSPPINPNLTSQQTAPTEETNVWNYFKKLLEIGEYNEDYHKYSAIRNGVVILGRGIQAQRGVDVERYEEFQKNFVNPPSQFKHTDICREYLKNILSAEDVDSFESRVRSLPQNTDKSSYFIQDIMFAITSLLKNNPDMTTDEKNYADNFIKPFMQAIVDSSGKGYSYENREASLISINTILKQKGMIKNTSGGYKADGILRCQGIELLLVEICGAFNNGSRAKVQFDRHKGLYGILAMLNMVAIKYKYGSLSTFEKLRILFVHTKGYILQLANDHLMLNQIHIDNAIQLWSIQFINGIFVFRRITKCEVYLDYTSKSQTISNSIKFAGVVKEKLRESITVINALMKEHASVIDCIALGLADINDNASLTSIVKPVMHKLSEAKDGVGLYDEDPVSFIE